MTYFDNLSEKDWLKSIHASMRRSEGKKAQVSFALEADDVLTEQLMAILAAIEALREAIAAMPAPVVHVAPAELPPIPAPVVNLAPTDLTDVVNAVTGLKPGATASEIAAALADVIAPARASEDAAVPLRQVAEALEKLDFRLQGFGKQAYGGGAVSFSPAGVTQLAGAIGDATATGLVPFAYDYVDNTYTGEDLTQVVYKTGGAGGTTVATITMTYADGKLDTVTRT
jgi:hypothetical protein